jgi:hypothetical protein
LPFPRLSRLRPALRARRPQLLLALRITVSALLALVAALATGLPLPLWAVLTALILTQANLGRSLRAATDYMMATLGGAIYGGAIAVLVPHQGEAALLGVLALAVAPLALLAALNPRMNAAPITAVIVLLLPAITHGSPLESAINRVIEVALGAFTGLAVSFLLFRTTAHRQAIEVAARSLNLMATAVTELVGGAGRVRDVAALHAIQDGIGQALVQLETVAAEATHERSVKLADEPDNGPLLRTLLRLRHDLVIIGRATARPMPEALHIRMEAPMREVAAAYADYMRGSGRALAARQPPPSLDGVRLVLEHFALALSAIRRDGLTRVLSDDDAERFFAVGFALEQMHGNFRDLERCVTEWTRAIAADG